MNMKKTRSLILSVRSLLPVLILLLAASPTHAQVTVSPSSLEWDAGDSSTKYVTVNSSGYTWQTDSLVYSGHFHLSVRTGSSGTSVAVTPTSANLTHDDITGDAWFQAGSAGAALELIHRGATYCITTEADTLHWMRDDAAPKTINVSVSLDDSWSAVLSGGGFILSQSGSQGNGSVTVAPEGCTTTFGRTATLILSCGPATKTVQLIQDVSDERVPIAGHWTLTRTYTEADNASRIEDITFYNGLGYPEQTVQVGASPSGTAAASPDSHSGNNIVTPVAYDGLLRDDAIVYLPYVSPDKDTAVEDPAAQMLSRQASFWNGLYPGEGAYATSLNDRRSSLDRLDSSQKPGKDWAMQEKEVHYQYNANAIGEVRYYTLVTSGNGLASLSVSGTWPEGTLYKDSVTDEDNCEVITFSDKLERVVMERRSPGPGMTADTYYIYDAFGYLGLVLSPEGNAALTDGTYSLPDDHDENATVLARFAYLYENDGLGRVTAKKIPGKAWERYVYDPAGRVLMSQDGRLRAAGEWWTVYVYDAVGNEVLRGLYQETTRASKAARAYWQGRANQSGQIPSASIPLYQCNYGSYSHVDARIGFRSVSGVTSTPDQGRIRGLKTWERLAVLTDSLSLIDGYVDRSFWYDTLGRCIQTVERRPENQLLRTSVRYGFRDEVLTSVDEYAWEEMDWLTWAVRTDYAYDDRGRLLSTVSSLDGDTLLNVTYAYDGLGRQVRTTSGNGVTESLSLDIRGWRTGQTVKKGAETLFSSVLRYNAPGYGSAAACWNGNIASQSWQHGTVGQWDQGYGYDRMDRLTGFQNTNRTDWPASREYAYDLNGNLSAVRDRDGAGIMTEEKMFPLSGNHRQSYAYDANGNVCSEGDEKTFRYNFLNLPALSLKDEGLDSEERAEWRYLADGTKAGTWKWSELLPALDTAVAEPMGLRRSEMARRISARAFAARYGKVTSSGDGGDDPIEEPVDTVSTIGRLGYLYAGPFRIRWNDAEWPWIESVAVPGGRIVYRNGTFQPDYYVTDHLGSTRLILDGMGNVQARYDYLPYGGRYTVSEAVPAESQYLFTGKERQDNLFGLDWYDSQARFQTTNGIFTSIDPLAEKYYSVSPYAYCAGNPINLIDSKGDSLAVLNLGGLIGHTALLIQNDEGKWAYYSMNGINLFDYSGGRVGGKGYHDLGDRTFESVESFLLSEYNSEGTLAQIANDEVNNYGFQEAYIIPSDKEQDKAVIKTFKAESQTAYRFFSHNCAIVAGRAFLSAEIHAPDGRVPNYSEILSFKPQWFFNNTKRIYKGTHVVLTPSL